MLSKYLNEELNKQITYEFFSSHLYLAMAAKLNELDFQGAAHYMIIQAEEERFHAMKIFNFIVEKNGKVEIRGFETPKTKGNNLLKIFEEALTHERTVTKRIELLMSIAQKEKDYSSINMLNWFIEEQIEEENTAEKYIKQIRLIGNNGHGLYQIDKEFSSRVFVAETSK